MRKRWPGLFHSNRWMIAEIRSTFLLNVYRTDATMSHTHMAEVLKSASATTHAALRKPAGAFARSVANRQRTASILYVRGRNAKPLVELLAAACRTRCRIATAQQYFKIVLATLACVFVDRHTNLRFHQLSERL